MALAHGREQGAEAAGAVALHLLVQAGGGPARGVLAGGGQAVAVFQEQVAVGGKRLPAVVIRVVHGHRADAAVLLPLGKGRDLVFFQVDRTVAHQQTADQVAVGRAEQLRVGLQVVLKDDADQFGEHRVAGFRLPRHQGDEMTAGVRGEYLEQVGQGGGEEQDRVLVAEGGSRHQVEDLFLLLPVRGEEDGELALLGAADDEIRDQLVLRIDVPEEVEQVAVTAAVDPLLHHRHEDVAEGGVVQVAAQGHDRVGVGRGQVAGGLHPRGRGGLAQHGHTVA